MLCGRLIARGRLTPATLIIKSGALKMTDNGKMNTLTVKPAAKRLVPRARRVTVIVLVPPDRQDPPPVWLSSSGFQGR